MSNESDTSKDRETSHQHSEQGSEDEGQDDTIAVASGELGEDEQMENGVVHETAAEPTNYSLFANPPSLGLIRQRLFDIEDPIEMSLTDLDTYFPFVDNVWRKSRSGDAQRDTNSTTDIYWCRLRKPTNAKPYIPKPTPEGKTSRKKRVREDKTCPMALKVTRTDGVARSCTVARAVGREVRHTHDLDYMDGLKRNSGIMDIARREAVRGFLPGSVFWKMLEEPDRMEEAGGKFMKISDVRNVQYAWRQENPTYALKAHTGYNQTRLGSRPKPATPETPNIQARVVQHVTPQSAPPPQPPSSNGTSRGTLYYPDHAREFLEPYLPNLAEIDKRQRPHVTLTWATSLDARIALMPGVQTAISGPETKAMTHYLRSRHDAILVGVRTALADDPSLNCRLAAPGGDGGIDRDQQPRPIIIDPNARLPILPERKVLQIASEGGAKGPWVVVAPHARLHPSAVQTLKSFGGEYLLINDINPHNGRVNWDGIFNVLYKEGIKSIMVEGGGRVLSDLLHPRWIGCIDSLVLTIAPSFFGRAGVEVSPDPNYDEFGKPIATRLCNVRWQPMGDADVVMCGQMRQEAASALLPGIQEFSKGPPK